jgi:hypothetical protein
MEYDIILSNIAYNPRTKGKLRKFLTELLGENRFYMLGNGGSFTGFSIPDPITDAEYAAIEKHLESYPSKATIEKF